MLLKGQSPAFPACREDLPAKGGKTAYNGAKEVLQQLRKKGQDTNGVGCKQAAPFLHVGLVSLVILLTCPHNANCVIYFARVISFARNVDPAEKGGVWRGLLRK